MRGVEIRSGAPGFPGFYTRIEKRVEESVVIVEIPMTLTKRTWSFVGVSIERTPTNALTRFVIVVRVQEVPNHGDVSDG